MSLKFLDIQLANGDTSNLMEYTTLMPRDVNVRFSNIKMTAAASETNIVYFELPRSKYDIFWSVVSFTNQHNVINQSILYGEVEHRFDLGDELKIPLYNLQYDNVCVKIEYANDVPDEIEMIFSAAVLQPKYKK